MTTPPIHFERLTAAHDVKLFTCEVPSVQNYLRKFALVNSANGYTSTFIALEEGSPKVLGFFSLSATSISPKDMPPEEMKGMPRYPIPGVLLAQMGRDLSEKPKNRRLGELLLFEAMRTALHGGVTIGWRFLVIDAVDASVVAFYVKYGFKPLPDTPLRLYMSSSTVEAVMRTVKPTSS